MKPLRIEEPTRWLDPDSGAPAEVRALLAEGRGALEPTPDELARLGSFVASAGTAGGSAAAAAKTALVRHGLTKAAAMKLAAVLTVGTVGGAVGWSATHRSEAPRVLTLEAHGAVPPTPREGRPVVAATSQGESSPPVDLPAKLSAAPLPPAPPVSSPRAQTRSAPGPAPIAPLVTVAPSMNAGAALGSGTGPLTDGPSAVPQPPVSESELTLLDRARSQIGIDPAAAMRALDAHLVLYPSGRFAQEREVLAIEALVQLGRRPEAETRAAAFDRAFPTSAHRRRIAVLLGKE